LGSEREREGAVGVRRRGKGETTRRVELDRFANTTPFSFKR